MATTPDIRIQVRIFPLVGPGKIQLLEAIDRHGSIAAAARVTGTAYANAWKLVDGLNRHFQEPLVVRVTGGKRGGGASLTETGRAVLEIFRSVETRARLLFAGDVDALSLLLAPTPAAEGCDALEAGPGSADCRARKLRKQRPAAPPL